MWYKGFQVSHFLTAGVLPDLISQRDDVKFLGILKNDGDGPYGGAHRVPCRWMLLLLHRIAASHFLNCLTLSEMLKACWLGIRATFKKLFRVMFLVDHRIPRIFFIQGTLPCSLFEIVQPTDLSETAPSFVTHVVDGSIQSTIRFSLSALFLSIIHISLG